MNPGAFTPPMMNPDTAPVNKLKPFKMPKSIAALRNPTTANLENWAKNLIHLLNILPSKMPAIQRTGIKTNTPIA